MNFIDTLKSKIDTLQQSHPALAFPVAVIKRYGDDNAGKQAALITYYGFLALFPLLLIFITATGIVASGNPELQSKISHQVFQYFPALGSGLEGSLHTLKGSGLALLLEVLALLYGARGLAAMLQEAFNNVWHVEKEHRPGFIGDNLRSFAMMAAVGFGILVGTILSYIIGTVLHLGIFGTIAVVLLNLVTIFGLFLVVFRLGTASSIKSHWLILGAFIAGTGLLIIQHFGGRIMAHELPKLSSSYGSFALALGMMFWLYLQAQVLLYSLEITAVRAYRDWPKKLFD